MCEYSRKKTMGEYKLVHKIVFLMNQLTFSLSYPYLALVAVIPAPTPIHKPLAVEEASGKPVHS